MFDQIPRNLAPPAPELSSAELLASLYADPEDAAWFRVPTLASLYEAFLLALKTREFDAALAINVEISRIKDDEQEVDPAVFGSKAGLWRLR